MQPQEIIAQASQYLENNDPSSALSLLSTSASQNQSADLWLELSKIFEELGNISQARTSLTAALKCTTDSSLLNKISNKLRTYQELLKGKEEHDEFYRLKDSIGLIEGSLWHIVSKKWLKTWEEFLLWNGAHPGVISNVDLIEPQEIINDLRPNKAYTNKILKNSVSEKVDFELIPKVAYSFLQKRYKEDDSVLKRWCISLNDDGSGLHIELRYHLLKVILLPDSDFRILRVNISRIETISALKEKLTSHFTHLSNFEFRAWKAKESPDLKNIQRNKKFTINGKLLQESSMIEDSEIAETDVIIAEFRHLQDWVLYKPNDICNYCKNSGELKSCSVCKIAKYCSRSCQVDDFKTHKEFCKKFKKKSVNGIIGLENLGFTCFINSSLQCVLHTLALKEYFISETYKNHLNTQNPLGTKDAALAKVFAELMESVWLGESAVITPWAFKKVISRFAPQFTGYDQHDSHELLTYLLSGLHEDLNRVLNKPYVEVPECEGQSDEKASAANWDWFLLRNKSIIVENFYGQLKSSLKCPKCSKVSVTFDPFLTLTVNIPSFVKRKFSVNVAFQNFRVIKQKFDIISNTTVLKLKSMLISKFKIENILICYYKNNSMQGVCDDHSDVGEYVGKKMVAYECCKNIKESYPLPIKLYLDKPQGKEQLPFMRMLFLEPETSFSMIYACVDKAFQTKYKLNIINTAGHSGIFSKKRLPCDFCKEVTCTNCELPRTNMSLKQASETMTNSEGQMALELILTENKSSLEQIEPLFSEIIQENTADFENLTLLNCLKYSMNPETLDIFNEWYCPRCKLSVQALKLLEIYILPKVLIFQLARFKNRGTFSQKNTDFVYFPLRGLSLESVMIGKNTGIYDLYAVCYHFGALGGGHYTAAVIVGQEWYYMDDSKTKPIPEDHVVAPEAYLLFYKLRN